MEYTDEEIADIGILILWKYPDGEIDFEKYKSLPVEEQEQIYNNAVAKLEKLQKRIANRRKLEEAIRIKKEFKEKQSRPMTEEDIRKQKEKRDKKWQDYKNKRKK